MKLNEVDILLLYYIVLLLLFLLLMRGEGKIRAKERVNIPHF